MHVRRPLQNRVDPFGDLHAVSARGTLMGNRGGCLHNDQLQLGRRRWTSRRWIACVLEFKERHRTVMTPDRYTELFFLDEATALAAGHRPCFECRRREARAFADVWARAADLLQPPSADAMDRRLHSERMVSRDRGSSGPLVCLADLPNGVMVSLKTGNGDRSAWMVLDGTLRRWSFTGYEMARSTVDVGEAELITAPSIVAVLNVGYPLRLHPSAYAS
ncbi:MAG: hypothetical protein V3S24_04040 [Candidatus Tectomicrobia bacterium]